ncbi:MAG: phenylalanine--tRNA ligase subunit beta [Eubacteriales bacterium]|nr:phenylalanine--tRNA ligase subunit beta [Eubacteriales bacterium]
MILSRNWLNEFVPNISVNDIDDKAFSEAMTISGSKVETFEELGHEISNVVVGRVTEMKRHPNSDHMWVCQIDVGDETVQICTGAWNVHAGDLVPVAKHKSTLPGGIKITKGKLRGEASNGMLCGMSELGLDEHDFPYGVIEAAAILGDYHPIDKEHPSIPADIQPGHKIFGKVIAAQITGVETVGYSTFSVTANTGDGTAALTTNLQNLHEGDMVALNTADSTICTLADLHAEQKEFPNCIPDGIFILNEEGIAPGDDIKPIIGMDDHVVEFEITPNRPDCLSVIGLAREASATFQQPLTLHTPEVKGCGGSVMEDLDVEIEDPALCPRYTARMVKNVKIAPSPKWMRERLRSSGVRPINNIVDITNYVMLEYGQPMHAFDFSCVEGGKLIIRTAREGETIQTLDGNERKLTTSMLCICDENKPVCVAGVMGGANSEIVGDTAAVVFESANFNGVSVRRTATALGMRTEASGRYEKGLDPMNTYLGVQRACELVELLGAGEVVDGVIDVIAADKNPTTVLLEPDKINNLLGTDISKEAMIEILLRLGFTMDGDTIIVPSWRSDVEHYSDIAEEVARFFGYNNLPVTLMRGQTTRGGLNTKQKAEVLATSTCRSLGYSEIMTYSFISPSYYDKVRMPVDSPKRDSIRILNPLGEDTSIMRTTAVPSMLEVLARNEHYHNPKAMLYELARIYGKREGTVMADERQDLILGAYGGGMDFFRLKGAVEAILKAFRVDGVSYIANAERPAFHPGRCADVTANGQVIGTLGEIHPLVAKNYDVTNRMYLARLDFTALLALEHTEITYKPLPKYPSVARDIAVVCDADLPVGELEACIAKSGKGLVKEIALFDIYTGAPIPAGKKSVAFSLKLRSEDHTLTDAESDEDVKAILAALEQEKGAVLR